MLVFNSASVAVLWFGAHRVDLGQMQVGAPTAFMTYLMQILMSVMMGVMMSMMILRAAVSAGRISEVLDTESSVHQPAHPTPIPAGRTRVEFADVDFRYPGPSSRCCAAEFPRRARSGDGHRRLDGCAGKSTLVGLVPWLYDVSGGSLRPAASMSGMPP